MAKQMNRRKPRTNRSWGTCPVSGKVRYGERWDAVAAIKHAFHQRAAARLDGQESTNSVVRAYKCAACRGYHTTSTGFRVSPGFVSRAA